MEEENRNKNGIDCECVKLFEQGIPFQVRPGVFIDKNTKLYKLSTVAGKMQQMAFTYGEIWTTAVNNIDKSIELVKHITREDSHLYFPTGSLTSRSQIIQNVIDFGKVAQDVSIWIPSNAWCFDRDVKFGRVNSAYDAKYLVFTVEIQFRQNRINRNRPEVTNDTWSFFIDPKMCTFFQVKEWLDGRVRALQNENPQGDATLCLDYNNKNVTPWPPIFPGKEQCLFPITVSSGCAP
ncbi:hypothetical protein COL52_31985 [Bacillus toyonensis]|uniref:Uncharacterized protein n=1 Tax=Bacillus toyonensis TaxID=155322 RepID=A0A2B6QS61_9BACI|nr:hypothetical protein [Bacillus toyonensis]PEJ82361.1 hypothetical protein CN688_32385 [Bacillus toyonensis]PEK75662.1 hypothetical protein CN594_30005 [Bacillus toyonensis]PEL10259.1 hypothetical protein CN624_33710 [Bacillus toyonensis]PFY35422.1 hypothetical protein COL54_29295 [Bacillus toyonensis]PFY53076.1 hypothetical protein COL52_31985 [Bacillus toyonensis]